jgi:hypothetical protein
LSSNTITNHHIILRCINSRFLIQNSTMAAPGEEGVPLEYSGPSNTRRGPKKLQDIGIGRFKRQGVAQHFHPNSAAGIFNKQAAEQRTEAWLRGTPANAQKDKAKSKTKARRGAKSKEDDATSTTTKDAVVEGRKGNRSTGPAVAVAQMGQGKKAVEHGKSQDQTQGDASTVMKAPSRKAVRIVEVPRHVKPTSGPWGQRAVENAKKAAAKAVATSYATTPITIEDTDGELSTTVIPTTPELPIPKPIIPRAAALKPKSVPTQNVTTKTARKPATKSRASKKAQAPMWSDSDSDDQDQDEDDLNDSLFSSRIASPATRTPRSRTTKNSGTSKKPNPRRKTRDQSTPQKKRQVRFAPSQSPEEAEEAESISTNITSTTQQNPKPASQKQQQQQPTNPRPTPYSTLNLPQALFYVPPRPKQTPSDPAELADDEDSQILSAQRFPSAQRKKTTTAIQNPKPTFTPTPVFTPTPSLTPASKSASKKSAEQEPPRRKGVAQPPFPKRARATNTTEKKKNNSDNDNDNDFDANDSAGPARKKAKPTVEKTTKSTNKNDLPARKKKKGVATKVKPKRARPVVGDESDDDDDDYEA